MMGRFLLVSNAPRDPDAGASRVHLVLADGLRARDHHVVDLHRDDIAGLGAPALDLLARRTVLPRLMSRAAARHDPESFDAIMASSGVAAPLFDTLRSRARRPVLLNHLHGLAVYDHVANLGEHGLGLARASRLNRLVTGPRQVSWDDRGVRAADVTVVQNLRDRSYLQARYPERPVALVEPCLVPALAGLAPAPDSVRRRQLAWFGTWEARKGAHLVPDALRDIRREHPDVRLVLGGTGRSEAEVLAHFDRNDRGSVEVLEHVTVSEQARILRESSIMLFPSLSEGFGLAVLEAAAFGCVPVTTATGFGADHVTHGHDGMVVAPTALHLARAVCRLLHDPLLLQAMSRRIVAVAETFTADHMVDAYEALLTGTQPSASALTTTTSA